MMRIKFDRSKSIKLRSNPKRGIGFEEAIEVWNHFHYEAIKYDDPLQFFVVGWASGKLYTVVFEVRCDEFGEYNHLITLWKSTNEEKRLYEENI